MKKILFLAFAFIPLLSFAQLDVKKVNNTNQTTQTLDNLTWDKGSKVIRCSDFRISKPVREMEDKTLELQNRSPFYEEYPDKRDMPVQDFEEDRKGNDPSIIQKEHGKSPSKAPIQSWDGYVNAGGRPNDPTGAAGPNYYIQATNGDVYRIWDKTGTLQHTGNISDFWNPAFGGDGDPIVLYDKDAGRWFIGQFGGSGDNGLYIAISQTGDPLGSWYAYTFTSPDFPDYEKFSAWHDGYYMTANYAQKIFAFNRTKMLAGDGTAEAVYQTFSPPQSGFFVPMPADASDGTMPTSGPCPIFCYQDDGWVGVTTDAMNIYNASVNWTTLSMTVTQAHSLPTNAFDASYDASWNDIEQPGTTDKLDGIGGAMAFRAQWKPWCGYNTVVLNWAVQVSASQRGIYWMELRQDQSSGNWSIYQQGIYAPGTDNVWLGSIAMNDEGSIGLAYAKTNKTGGVSMSLAYAGRLACDPLGTLPISEVMALTGSGYQHSINRVGDYAHTCLDPDGVTFWHTNEYISKVGQWDAAKTRVYSFQLPGSCPAPTISSVSETSLFEDRGKQLTIQGTNLSGCCFDIGGVYGTEVSNNGTTAVVNFPPANYPNPTADLNVSIDGNTVSYSTITISNRNDIPVVAGSGPTDDEHPTISSAVFGLHAWYGNTSFDAGERSGTMTINVGAGAYADGVTLNSELNPSATNTLDIVNNGVVEIDASGNDYGFNLSTVDYVTLKGFTVHDAGIDNIYLQGDNCEVYYNKSYNAGSAGIKIETGTSNSVHNNLSYNNSIYGLHLNAASNTIKNNTLDNNGSLSFATPQTITKTFSGSVAIPDNGCGSSNYGLAVLNVPENVVITDINVLDMNITHTWDEDLHIYLFHPDNTTNIKLCGGIGGNGDNFTNTDFDDEAGTGIGSGAAPFTGQFQPEESLTLFDGMNSTGDWTLLVCDAVAGDNGTITGYKLQITYNIYSEDGDGIYVEGGANNIFQNNISVAKAGNDAYYALTADVAIHASSDYNTYYSTNTNTFDYLGATNNVGANETNQLTSDPKFVGGGDYHLQSLTGSYTTSKAPIWPPDTESGGVWSADLEDSPSLSGNGDAYANEPEDNGDVINRGVYGNTAQASKGPPLPCTYPINQATSLVATPASSTTVDLTWTRGTPSPGDEVIIVAKATSAVDNDPIDGTNYTANATFGSGDETVVASANYVVYIGTGTSTTVTGLTTGTTYHFAIYENNNVDNCYLTPGVIANATPTAVAPSITTVSPNSFFADKGKQITITGTDLTGATNVNIAGVNGTINSNTATEIVVTFPAGLYINSTLTVTTGGGSDTDNCTVNTRNIIPVDETALANDDTHQTIQSALDGLFAWFGTSAFSTSTAGYLAGTKTIDVYNGTYTDIVTPNATLGTTASETLIIQNHAGEQPEIDASGNVNGVYIGTLDYVTLTGFTIHGATGENVYTEGDNNQILFNKIYGSTAGSGIVLSSALSTLVQNNLVYENNQFGIRLIASNNASLVNNTVADNGNEAKNGIKAPPLPSIYEPAQVYVESGTGVSLKNNILASLSGSYVFTLKTESGVTVTTSYNTYFKNGNTYVVNYDGTVYADFAAWPNEGTGDIETDPQFVNAAGDDYHIKSVNGSYPYPAQWPPEAAASAWNNDATTSTALDTGDPADPFANEPESGNRINQGAYGNTAQASKSATSSFVWEGDDATTPNDWNTGENWSGGVVPTATDDATIPDVSLASNEYPIVDEADATCQNLNMHDAAHIEITTGGSLTVTQNFIFGGGASGTMTMSGGDLNVTSTLTAGTGSNITYITGSFSLGTKVLNVNSIFTYGGNNQTMFNWAYQDVVLNGTGTMLVSGTIATPTVCDDFTINNTGNVLNIAEGKALTVNGTLTNNVPGNTGLVVKSSATGDGSIIFNNAGVNGVVERYLSKTIGEAGQWHFVGSPVTAATLSLFNTNNFYYYDETADDWWTGPTYFYNDPSGWQTPSTDLNVGEGYIYYYYEHTLNYEGEINYNAAGYTSTLGYTTHPGTAANGDPYTKFDGWKLVSNPYPSALNWNSMNLTDVNNTVYFYDDGTNNYKYFNGAGGTQADEGISVNGGSQHIPMGQGFFIKTDNPAGGSFTIPNTAREHNSQAFWKVPKSPANLIRLQLDFGEYTDETVVHFREDAKTEFEGDYDAYKRFSWEEEVPQIFTCNLDKNMEFAINVLESKTSHVIPLAYKVGNVQEYTIRITEMNQLDFDYIYLEDLRTNTLVNLFEQSEYTFMPQAAEIEEDRFLLHFGMNQAPSLEYTVASQEVLEDSEISLNVQNVFADLDLQDSFTLSAKMANGNELPEWLHFNSATGVFNGTPENEDVGMHTIKLIATDSYGATSETVFEIKVINTNDAPILTFEPEDQITYDGSYWFYQLRGNTFTDIDLGDQLTYSATLAGESLPEWINFYAENKSFTANPKAENLGSHTIEVTATDIWGASETTSFVLTVLTATGLEQLANSEYFVYPNPSNGMVHVYSEAGFGDVSKIVVTDVAGKKIYENQVSDNYKNVDIDLSNVEDGVYMISIIKNDKIINKQVIIK